MTVFHEEGDSLEQVKRDARDSDNACGDGTPDAVRQSARAELAKRGMSRDEIDEIRLN